MLVGVVAIEESPTMLWMPRQLLITEGREIKTRQMFFASGALSGYVLL